MNFVMALIFAIVFVACENKTIDQIDNRTEVEKLTEDQWIIQNKVKFTQETAAGTFINKVVVVDGKYKLSVDFQPSKSYFEKLAADVRQKSGKLEEDMIVYIGFDGNTGDGSTGQYFSILYNDLKDSNSSNLLSSLNVFEQNTGDLGLYYFPGNKSIIDCSVYVKKEIIDQARGNTGFKHENFYSKELISVNIGI